MLDQPENGFFIGGYCANSIGSICGLKCRPGFTLYGTSFRKCEIKNNVSSWTGVEPYCRINHCKQLKLDEHVKSNCSEENIEYGTKCRFSCPDGYFNLGSSYRFCLAIGLWSGLDAKCTKRENLFPLQPTTSSLPYSSRKNTQTEFKDLSQLSLSFGYSFKKIKLYIESVRLPLTFSFWLRSNYTKNIKIIHYYHSCFNISVLSNDNSSLIVDFSFYQDADLSIKSYYFDLNKQLIKNSWLQLIFLHDEHKFRIFINGVPELSLEDFSHIFNLTYCSKFLSEKKENNFKITDDLESTDNEYFQPMRGEITRAYLYNYELNEEEILSNFFKCDTKISNRNESLIAFDWSNVQIDNYLSEFKKKSTNFCQNCKEPDLIKHAFLYYDGTRTGDVLLYECQKGYRIVGESTSVCMIYGSWSHKTPRCKRKNI
ncbi:unnamed protein product [Brachionus calyciflorus]|uniref:Sushi domain-containing protein n=1 Tax=Brachionus calyciflorus TaxID=104777 RepID=A0A813MPY9_9BILA|nr:unnamed protein product [Brachionus calyciflorus]